MIRVVTNVRYTVLERHPSNDYDRERDGRRYHGRFHTETCTLIVMCVQCIGLTVTFVACRLLIPPVNLKKGRLLLGIQPQGNTITRLCLAHRDTRPKDNLACPFLSVVFGFHLSPHQSGT